MTPEPEEPTARVLSPCEGWNANLAQIRRDRTRDTMVEAVCVASVVLAALICALRLTGAL